MATYSGGSDTPEVSAAAAETTDTESTSITPFAMFRALIGEMKGSTGTCHMDIWKTTICELFAVEYFKLPIRVEALPLHKKRFPHLKDAEASSLLRLFEASGYFKLGNVQRVATDRSAFG